MAVDWERHPRLRELRFTLVKIFRNPTAVLGGILLLGFTATAVLAPVIAPPKYPDSPYRMPRKG